MENLLLVGPIRTQRAGARSAVQIVAIMSLSQDCQPS